MRTPTALPVGGVILKTNVVAGLTVLAISPPIWVLGRLPADAAARAGQARRLLLITAGVTAVALVTLAVALRCGAPSVPFARPATAHRMDGHGRHLPHR